MQLIKIYTQDGRPQVLSRHEYLCGFLHCKCVDREGETRLEMGKPSMPYIVYFRRQQTTLQETELFLNVILSVMIVMDMLRNVLHNFIATITSNIVFSTM